MLNELLRHQRQAKTAEDTRLITLTKELERATTGLDRLYQAIEQGSVSIDDTLRMRTQKLKARRCEILTEMAKVTRWRRAYRSWQSPTRGGRHRLRADKEVGRSAQLRK